MEIFFILIGFTILGIFLYVQKYFAQKKKDAFGRLGEVIVNRKLKFWLGWGGAKIYDDVLFVTASGNTTQIDHVVISRKGIFCIETKHLNGVLKGDINDKSWKHTNKQGKRNVIYNPLFQNSSHIKHLSEALEVDVQDVEGFVTNVGDAQLKGNISPLFGKAAIQKGTSFIIKLWLRSSSKFTKDEVKHFIEVLDQKIKDVDRDMQGKHIDYVKKMKGDHPLSFVLNYLYFVIAVLLIYIFYKLFYQ